MQKLFSSSSVLLIPALKSSEQNSFITVVFGYMQICQVQVSAHCYSPSTSMFLYCRCQL